MFVFIPLDVEFERTPTNEIAGEGLEVIEYFFFSYFRKNKKKKLIFSLNCEQERYS